MKSPVTYLDNADVIDEIASAQIIQQYKEELAMDISHYFTNIPSIQIMQCRDTKYRFYYPETIFGNAAFYEELQKKDFYYTKRDWEHKTAAKFVKKEDAVLDVGCGLGLFLQHLKKAGVNNVKGLELNPKAIEVCRQKGLNVINEMIADHADKHTEEYDVVCAFQVLEHIYDIKDFVDGCCKALKKGGKLIFAVPNNFPYFLKYDRLNTLNLPPHHAGLWDKETFRSLPGYFPVSFSGIYVEPLLNRHNYLETYLRTHNFKKTLKVFKKIRPGLINRLVYPMKFFTPGKTLVAVFEK